MRNPLRRIFDFNRRELPVAVLLFFFFFCIIAVFQMLRPLKSGLFIDFYKKSGADWEMVAKLGNILIAALAVAVFSWLYSRLRRHHLIYVLSGFFIACFVVLIQALDQPRTWAVWSFYWLGDLVTTLMVAAFWAYATDLTTSDQAKRLFGVVGGGGVIGGMVGSYSSALLLPSLGQSVGMAVLLTLSSAYMLAVIVVAAAIENRVRATRAFRLPEAARSSAGGGGKSQFSEAVEGARLVAASRYLLAIVVIMACYEMASQVMDYQYKLMVQDIVGGEAKQIFMARVGAVTNTLSVILQFFVVSYVMKRFGVQVALLFLPLAILGSSVSFLAFPSLLMAAALFVSDNGLNYSVQQTARESLYAVTTRDEKYKARAFTNMFVQRFAKGLAIVGALGLKTFQVAPRWLGLVAIGMAAAIILASVYAGRQFALRTAREEEHRQAA